MRTWLLAVLLLPAGGGAADSAPAGALAVIVHGEVPADGLSLGELKKIFLGDRQFWEKDLRVVVLVPPTHSPERAALLDKVYQKTETQYRHYWIAKVFREEAQSAPKRVDSVRAATELVRRIPGAISVVDAAAPVPAGLKVLRVDGKSPSEDGYPLR